MSRASSWGVQLLCSTSMKTAFEMSSGADVAERSQVHAVLPISKRGDATTQHQGLNAGEESACFV